MTKAEYLLDLEKRVRSLLREVYLHGVGRISDAELKSCLKRERATKGFHDDITRLWRSEMELIGYDDGQIPALQYAWVPGVNGWAFVWKGFAAQGPDGPLDWKFT